VDWEEVGYRDAEYDVSNGSPYDDVPLPNCDDGYEYRTGYANGWRDAKLANI